MLRVFHILSKLLGIAFLKSFADHHEQNVNFPRTRLRTAQERKLQRIEDKQIRS